MKESLSERLFNGSNAEYEIEEKLCEAGVEFEKIGWDDYDNSIEIYGVAPEHRLNAEAQQVIKDAGFSLAYVNHTDKWETHYTFYKTEEKDGKYVTIEHPIPIKGWRVSYPHKRNEIEGKIWVEEHIESWPASWFKTGYVEIKEPK